MSDIRATSEVNQRWLQNGYKKFEDAVKALKCVDYLDKKRIESAFYDHKSKSDARVGINDKTREALKTLGF